MLAPITDRGSASADLIGYYTFTIGFKRLNKVNYFNREIHRERRQFIVSHNIVSFGIEYSIFYETY